MNLASFAMTRSPRAFNCFWTADILTSFENVLCHHMMLNGIVVTSTCFNRLHNHLIVTLINHQKCVPCQNWPIRDFFLIFNRYNGSTVLNSFDTQWTVLFQATIILLHPAFFHLDVKMIKWLYHIYSIAYFNY